MNTHVLRAETAWSRDVAVEGEHPDVIVADVCRRPRPRCRVIVVANEKGGVGKSTIAFQLAVAMADAGLAVVAIDLDRRQQTLATVLRNREGTARRLGIVLPLPRHLVLGVQSGAVLCQEINRVACGSDVVVIDVAGFDTAIGRRAIAIADTLITPVNSSFVDLDLLGKFHPVSHEFLSEGCFATTVNEIRAARLRKGLPDLDWIVAQNRLRRNAGHNQGRVEAALAELAPKLRFRLSAGLTERVAYRELFLLGLSHLDLRRIPEMARARCGQPRNPRPAARPGHGARRRVNPHRNNRDASRKSGHGLAL